MYFLFDENFVIGAVVQELLRPVYPHDSKGSFRRLCFIDLCYYTVAGHENLQDYTDLARLTNVKDTQAKIVWDILVKHNVLRLNNSHGYSAREWMVERGILGDPNKWRKRSDNQSPQSPQIPQTSYRTNGSKTSW